MKLSVFGLGYVGAVSAACFSNDGHDVIGVDVSADKVALINSGKSPIVEPGLQELLERGRADGRISGTVNSAEAVLGSDASLISVGTPPMSTGEPNLGYVYEVVRQIGAVLRDKTTAHPIILRSTVPPGTLSRCREILEELLPAERIQLAFNPEFLREGSAVRDYYEPPYTVIGAVDEGAIAAVRAIYARVSAPVLVVAPEVAEMVKYIANTWHATKVAFANEIGRVAKSFGVDGREAMRIMAQDTKLNISPTYLRPGFAYGGSCLPKDVSALLSVARARNVRLPMLEALPLTNGLQVEIATEQVLRSGARRIAVLGLAFKSGTDDLRESPAVPLIKRLIGEGRSVRIFDRSVAHAHLVGTNLAYIRHNIPHFEALLSDDADATVADAELVVLTYSDPEFASIVSRLPRGAHVIDFAGSGAAAAEGLEYDGIAW